MHHNLSGAVEKSAPTRSGITCILVAVALLLPGLIAFGLTQLPLHSVPLHTSPVAHFPPASIAFENHTLGPKPGFRPQITNVQIVDLDRDGLMDLIACDGHRNRVLWYRQVGPLTPPLSREGRGSREDTLSSEGTRNG